jgi:hypothetical protein
MRRLIFPTMLLAAVFACQNYDFHHITPTPVTVVNFDASINAAPGTPYIMIVEDMSGSMCEPIAADGGITDSGTGAGDCAADLQTGSKIGLVATNITKVLSQLPSSNPDGGNPYYLGLTTFPGSANGDAGVVVQGCVPPSAPQVPIGLALNTIPGIESFYGGAINVIGGGTPTAEALSAAGTFFPQVSGNTTKYILLLTDGLPNCNLLHPCVVDHPVPVDAGQRGPRLHVGECIRGATVSAPERDTADGLPVLVRGLPKSDRRGRQQPMLLRGSVGQRAWPAAL